MAFLPNKKCHTINVNDHPWEQELTSNNWGFLESFVGNIAKTSLFCPEISI